jgi:menaquinone-specific isochorismate synthase
VLPRLALDGCPDGLAATFAAVADGRAAEAVLAEWLATYHQVMSSLLQPPVPPRPQRLTRRGEIPESHDWLDRARAAVTDIRAGRLDKVVLTRTVSVTAETAIDPAHLVRRLTERHPGCAILAVGRPDGILIAATPERLVRLAGCRVASDALAGTCPRSGDPRRALLGNAKERHEHRLVVHWITSGLADVCTALSLPDGPQVMTLPRLHHLWTPVRGRLRPGRGLLDVVQRLHPTPAVAGAPVAAALAWLERHGDHRPDWYTGAAGWVDLDGDGEVHVVLRAALLDGAGADLFAGAGIVADSDPEAELAETELKLRTLLEALDG